MLDDFLEKEIAKLELANLRRELRLVEGAQGAGSKINGRYVLNFCSNNYLGLADDECLKNAAIDAIQAEGFGSGASRLICGNMSSHAKLEERLAKFKECERALVFSTGYMANVGIISSLFGRDDVIFSDRLNHASIVDGILLSQATLKRYPHCDMAALEEMLKAEISGKRKIIITDSVFSMDGDCAPLDQIVALAQRYECVVMIDEAHALGVLGVKGRGLAEYMGLEKKIDIQMGTLSKAAGSFGAYCCGSKSLIDYLINFARSFIYTTAMPPSVAAASIAAIDVIEREPQRREQLNENARYMRGQLKLMGFDTGQSITPIIPILIRDEALTLECSRLLFETNVFVSAIRPPTVPKGTSRLRLTVMATHSKKDLDFALNQFERVGKRLRII
jgi:8-amino-7-oxononanoate synthase